MRNILHQRSKKRVLLLFSHPKILREAFDSIFKSVSAAGGIVVNSKNQFLMIKRFNHWDLPKGIIESGEAPMDAAVREVHEETGVRAVIVEDKPQITQHIYRFKGVFVLKTTYWYHMLAQEDDFTPIPQKEEDIELAQWINENDLPYYVAQSYKSMQSLIMSRSY